jgi:hypothetical protein
MNGSSSQTEKSHNKVVGDVVCLLSTVGQSGQEHKKVEVKVDLGEDKTPSETRRVHPQLRRAIPKGWRLEVHCRKQGFLILQLQGKNICYPQMYQVEEKCKAPGWDFAA